jgi:hypothetical protein
LKGISRTGVAASIGVYQQGSCLVIDTGCGIFSSGRSSGLGMKALARLTSVIINSTVKSAGISLWIERIKRGNNAVIVYSLENV